MGQSASRLDHVTLGTVPNITSAALYGATIDIGQTELIHAILSVAHAIFRIPLIPRIPAIPRISVVPSEFLSSRAKRGI